MKSLILTRFCVQKYSTDTHPYRCKNEQDHLQVPNYLHQKVAAFRVCFWVFKVSSIHGKCCGTIEGRCLMKLFLLCSTVHVYMIVPVVLLTEIHT